MQSEHSGLCPDTSSLVLFLGLTKLICKDNELMRPAEFRINKTMIKVGPF